LSARPSLAPHTAEEVCEAITWAIGAGEPLEVIGGGTKRTVTTPGQTGYTLDMAQMAGIVSYEPEELVLTLKPGTAMAEVAAALDARGQMLAFEPPDYAPLLGAAGTPTFGGAFATNFAGPRRITAGAVRDHMLGLHAVSGRGEVFKAGGRVVKNVTGYDLARALAGSWGTLAVATELTVKVLPRPETEATLLLEDLDPTAAVAAMAAALGSSCDVSGAAHLPQGIAVEVVADAGPASVTALRIEGIGPSVEARVAEARRLFAHAPQRLVEGAASAAIWRAVRDAQPFVGSDKAVWRCSVPPMSGPAIAAAAPPDARVFLDWGGGLVMIETPATGDAGAARLRQAVESCGGHALLLRAPVDIRAEVATFHPMAKGLEALGQRLRNAFDPEGILNPHRMSRELA